MDTTPIDPNIVIPPLSHVKPTKPGHGIRIEIEFDGPIDLDRDLAFVLGTAAAKAFETMSEPAFVCALVELI